MKTLLGEGEGEGEDPLEVGNSCSVTPFLIHAMMRWVSFDLDLASSL